MAKSAEKCPKYPNSFGRFVNRRIPNRAPYSQSGATTRAACLHKLSPRRTSMTMSAALLQGGVTPASFRGQRAAKGAQHATRGASIRPARAARRLNVSCAAAGADAVKDKRVPVTVLTGFLGCVLRKCLSRVRPSTRRPHRAGWAILRWRKNPRRVTLFPFPVGAS
jgi:hypothetical protein